MNHFRSRDTRSFFIFSLLLGTLLVISCSVIQVHAAAQVQIISHTGYLASTGSYHVVGEVSNTGDRPLRFVKITATYYNSSGAMVATDFTYTSVDVLLPGRKSPFDVLFLEEAQALKIHHYSLTTSYSETSSIPQALMILSNSSYTSGTGSLHIVGEVKNTGTATATYVKIIATYYNSTGGVVAYDYDFSDPQDLSSNQTAPYDILLLSERVQYVHHYAITADSDQYAVVPELPTALFPALMIVTLLSAFLTSHAHRTHRMILKEQA